jgi:hypothetical protein
MRLRDEYLILGVAAGLALAVTLVVTSTAGGARREQVASAPSAAQQGAQQGAQETGALELGSPAPSDTTGIARTRTASEATDDESSSLDSRSRREGRRREAEALAQFQKLRTEQGSEALERAVREVLASRSEPLARKDAGLRALHEAGLPGTDALLAAAVREQPDVPDAFSPSVSRCALKLLYERAPASEDARRELARLAFLEEAGVSADLRRRASTALAASIRGSPRAEAERLLRLVATSKQLDAALEALARDANFGAARNE